MTDIATDRVRLERELDESRESLEKRPDSWVLLEATGRCFMALGQSEQAEPLLRRSLDERPARETVSRLEGIGAVHRLLGAHDLARAAWQRGREMAAEEASWDEAARRLAPQRAVFAYLVGEDDEALKLIEDMDGGDLGDRTPAVGWLAQCRRDADPELGRRAVEWFHQAFVREGSRVGTTNLVSLYDWLQIAEEQVEELRG